jgi:hypothetical protein
MSGTRTDEAQARLVSFFQERTDQRGQVGAVESQMFWRLAFAGAVGFSIANFLHLAINEEKGLEVSVREALRAEGKSEQVVQIARTEDDAKSVTFSAPPKLEKVMLRAPKAAGAKVCVDVFGLDSQEKQHTLGSYEGDLTNDWAPIAARAGECTLDSSAAIETRDFGR